MYIPLWILIILGIILVIVGCATSNIVGYEKGCKDMREYIKSNYKLEKINNN